MKIHTYRFFIDPADWIRKQAPSLIAATEIWAHQPEVYVVHVRTHKGNFAFARNKAAINFDTWESLTEHKIDRLTFSCMRPLSLSVRRYPLSAKHKIWCGGTTFVKMRYQWTYSENQKLPDAD